MEREELHTLGEVVLMLKAIDRRNDEKHQEQAKILARIEAQVIKTNGRVNRLETWRGFMTGGLAVVTALVIPILFKIFK